MTDSKELVDALRDPKSMPEADVLMDEAANLIERQAAALDLLDLTLCQFLNNVGDEYDPRVWLPSVRRDLQNLSEVYNACHKDGTMSLRRSSALTNKENTDD